MAFPGRDDIDMTLFPVVTVVSITRANLRSYVPSQATEAERKEAKRDHRGHLTIDVQVIGARFVEHHHCDIPALYDNLALQH